MSGPNNDAFIMDPVACILCSLGAAKPEWDGLRVWNISYRIAERTPAGTALRRQVRTGSRHAVTRATLAQHLYNECVAPCLPEVFVN